LPEHYGAQFRDPANFSKPTDPLSIPKQDNKPGIELSQHEFRERTAANSAAE